MTAKRISRYCFFAFGLGFLVYSLYLNTERPKVPDFAHGFTVPTKLISPVYVTPTEDAVVSYLGRMGFILAAVTIFSHARRK
jgi:hypothetical protein